MDMLKNIELEFENCESMVIPGNAIGDFLIDGIHSVIARIASNCIGKYDVAKTVVIEIYKEGDSEYHPFGIDKEKTTKFERMAKYRDITHINVNFDSGKQETYQIDYDEENPEYLGAPNKNEKIYMSDLGNLYIVIDESKDIWDFFDKDIVNNSESVNFTKDMCDIGIDEPEYHLFSDEIPEMYRYLIVENKDSNISASAVLVQDEFGKRLAFDPRDLSRIGSKGFMPYRWKYYNIKLEQFLKKEMEGTPFDIEILKKKFGH